MNKVKTTYEKVFNFIAGANLYLKANEEETKLKYAIERTGEKVNLVTKEYQQKLQDLRLEHAYSDDKGKVPFTIAQNGEREYEYTKEGLKALDKAIEDLFKSEVEVEVYYTTELPDGLDEGFKNLFKGFVIDEVQN